MFVPLLALGLPVTATAAVLLAAMRTYGIVPGPTLMTDQPDLVWTLLASLLIGNTLLLVINLPLAPLWAKLLQIPRPQLYAGILFFASLGAYAVNQSAFDVALLLVFGAVGFAVRRFGIPILPLILGVIIGPLMETKMREALDLSDGDDQRALQRAAGGRHLRAHRAHPGAAAHRPACPRAPARSARARRAVGRELGRPGGLGDERGGGLHPERVRRGRAQRGARGGPATRHRRGRRQQHEGRRAGRQEVRRRGRDA